MNKKHTERTRDWFEYQANKRENFDKTYIHNQKIKIKIKIKINK